MNSSTSSGASEYSILFSAIRSTHTLKPSRRRVSYFCGQLKVPTHFLPAKIYYGRKTSQPTVRYFVDKFPMFLASDPSSPSPVVTFTYIQAPEASLTEFVHHLHLHDEGVPIKVAQERLGHSRRHNHEALRPSLTASG